MEKSKPRRGRDWQTERSLQAHTTEVEILPYRLSMRHARLIRLLLYGKQTEKFNSFNVALAGLY